MGLGHPVWGGYGLLEIIGLFCRILSLFVGLFCKGDVYLKESVNRSQATVDPAASCTLA